MTTTTVPLATLNAVAKLLAEHDAQHVLAAISLAASTCADGLEPFKAPDTQRARGSARWHFMRVAQLVKQAERNVVFAERNGAQLGPFNLAAAADVVADDVAAVVRAPTVAPVGNTS